MEARVLRRPAIDLFSGLKLCITASNGGSVRHDSTYRRTKKMQNIKPESSFLFTNNSPKQDHIVFNPPSSAPSVLHTPLKFLPKDDKRRAMVAKNAENKPDVSRLPPPVVPIKPGYQRHHLTEADVAEIRRLRSTMPETWTRLKLAKKFNCSSLFVGMVCEATSEKKAQEAEKVEAVKARWGPKRKSAREDRTKRREAWYADA